MTEDEGNVHEASPKIRSIIAAMAGFRNPLAARSRPASSLSLIDSAVHFRGPWRETRQPKARPHAQQLRNRPS
jgi:hypothetical protein